MTAGGDSVRNIRRLKEVSDPMEPKRFTLCPACTACSEVEITDQAVTIGEDANVVRLSHAEWNELVRRIESGDLREVRRR